MKIIDIANTGFAVMGVISLLLSIVCPAIAPIYLVLYVATFTLLYLFDIGVYCNQFVDALMNDDLDTALECCNGIFYDLLGFFLAVVLDMLMDAAFDYMIKTLGPEIKSLFASMEDSLKSFWNDNGGYVNLSALGGKSGSESTNAMGKLVDGSSMKTDDVLDLATEFLGEGYTEPVPGSGRFVSADGTRVFRMGENDILGKHGGGPHVNFEILSPNPTKPGKMQVITDIHIFLED